jgi:hypothetical protein
LNIENYCCWMQDKCTKGFHPALAIRSIYKLNNNET